MSVAKVLFQVNVVFLTLGILTVATVALLEPSVATLAFLWQHGHTPLLAFVVVLVALGLAMRCTWQEAVGYLMAAFVLVGGLVAIFGILATAMNVASGEPSDIIQNCGVVTAVSAAMLGIAWLHRKVSGQSCMPQLKALVTFN